MGKMSDLDPNLITRKEHDVESGAKKVYLVGGQDINVDIDSDKLSEALKVAVENIQIPIPVVTIPEIKLPEIDLKLPNNDIKVIEVEKVIEIPKIETVEVEKTIVIKEIETKLVQVEIPVITKELEVVTIEIPVVTEVIKERTPAWVYSVFAVQFLLLVGTLYKLSLLMGYLK